MLEQGGIALNAAVPKDSLLLSYSREQFEKDPYRLLLGVMGGEAEEPVQAGRSGYPSDHIWHMDTECIEGPGSYQAIARRMATLAQGALPLLELEDSVDIDEEKA